MSSSFIDYSLYLVTDSVLNHGSRTVAETVEQAINGGVGIVQVREKELDDEQFTKLAREVHAVTKKYNVPLIINDRIDIAIAINADGVHVGQRDTPAAVARARIGPHKILGVSAETIEHARQAIADGANYIGIQTCFPTTTKTTPAIVQGHIGVRNILESIPLEVDVTTVAIGGLNESNVRRIVHKSKGSHGRRLDGVAVVTAIVAASEAREASARLRDLFIGASSSCTTIQENATVQKLGRIVSELLTGLRQKSPLVYHITNYVSMNDCANATLAIGASPIMAFAPEEVEDLVRAAGALVINIGTLTEDFIDLALLAGKHANALGKPVILDPVGVGATEFRRNAIRRIFDAMHVDVIKGNAGEIRAIAAITGTNLGVVDGGEVQAKGVDSVGAGFRNPQEVVRALASREHCVVAMTGKVDYISDRQQTVSLSNGHPLQSRITGSGCMVASVIASFTATQPVGHFASTVAGILCNNLAGEYAAKRANVHGPGTFHSAYFDELANLTPEIISQALCIDYMLF